MKKFSEKEVHKLELLSAATALLLAGFCVVYLLDILQNVWMLNFLLVFGFLLHMIILVTDLVRRNLCRAALAAVLAVCCLGALIYFAS